jgi:hypothetical protein
MLKERYMKFGELTIGTSPMLSIKDYFVNRNRMGKYIQNHRIMESEDQRALYYPLFPEEDENYANGEQIRGELFNDDKEKVTSLSKIKEWREEEFNVQVLGTNLNLPDSKSKYRFGKEGGKKDQKILSVRATQIKAR